MTERRGRKSTGRPRKKPLDKGIENDLIAENQRLRERNQYLEAELECLKKLSTLVVAEKQKKSKKPWLLPNWGKDFRYKYCCRFLNYLAVPFTITLNDKTDKYITEKRAIFELYEKNKQRYWYRRITLELHKNGIIINIKQCWG